MYVVYVHVGVRSSSISKNLRDNAVLTTSPISYITLRVMATFGSRQLAILSPGYQSIVLQPATNPCCMYSTLVSLQLYTDLMPPVLRPRKTGIIKAGR